MKGYLGQAAAAHCLEDGWLVTGDLVEVAGDRVQFRGRIDNVINVGGTKVLPEEVESVLLEVSGVREARVYGVPNPMTGAILAADVVLAEGLNEAEGRQRIFSLLSGRLAAFKVPRLYRFVKEMDINEAGKKVRSMV